MEGEDREATIPESGALRSGDRGEALSGTTPVSSGVTSMVQIPHPAPQAFPERLQNPPQAFKDEEHSPNTLLYGTLPTPRSNKTLLVFPFRYRRFQPVLQGPWLSFSYWAVPWAPSRGAGRHSMARV